MSSDAWSNLDKVDQKIIEILNENARTPSKEIATELRKSGHDVSDRTIRKRIKTAVADVRSSWRRDDRR